jgi:UDP-glucose 4-epimerase
MKVLATGIAGYIGSHTGVVLLRAGVDLVGIDNFSNSAPEALNRIKKLGGREFEFSRVDVRDAAAIDRLFASRRIKAVVHFAGLKSVAQSVHEPLAYFDNNVVGTINLLNACLRHGCNVFLFSSSAAVYGDSSNLPLREDAPLRPLNPYGQSKRVVEDILSTLHAWRVGCLRYFNPVGAHESGEIGEFPLGMPNNLMPLVVQAAAGRIDYLKVHGRDWPTHDGTGVRDYIHVMDLAEAHVAALKRLLQKEGSFTVNVGTGVGYSVLDILETFQRVNGVVVPYQFVGRRPGDVARLYGDVALTRSLLDWSASRNLEAMCRDHWNWWKRNPMGYVASSNVANQPQKAPE